MGDDAHGMETSTERMYECDVLSLRNFDLETTGLAAQHLALLWCPGECFGHSAITATLFPISTGELGSKHSRNHISKCNDYERRSAGGGSW